MANICLFQELMAENNLLEELNGPSSIFRGELIVDISGHRLIGNRTADPFGVNKDVF